MPVIGRRSARFALTAGVAGLVAPEALAQDAAPLNDRGDTAWMLTSTALVLFMNIPGLALFYGGLVRTKNALSVLMQCFALTGLITLLWLAYGYSVAFATQGMQPGVTTLHSFIGGLDKAFLRGVGVDSLAGSIPETLFFAYQMTFAIITPALIVGAFAERMKFSAMLWFMTGWFTLVYLPVCHMIWGGAGAYFADLGVLDFAGGIVVHVTAGVSALVMALALGKRTGWPHTPMPPHNLTLTVTGTGMLWVGWFGFNAGSALGASGQAAMALVATQISAAAAAITWMLIEWRLHGRPSVLGICTGSVAGLAAVTPASGFVGPVGGLLIGVAAGGACYWASMSLKRRAGYDDSLDVFGVHGVGGFLGTLLAGVFAAEFFGGNRPDLGIAGQVGVQAFAATASALWAAGVTWALVKGLDAAIGVRVAQQSEVEGLDLSQHGERGYNF
jgi:Amt family ammonium transporter